MPLLYRLSSRLCQHRNFIDRLLHQSIKFLIIIIFTYFLHIKEILVFCVAKLSYLEQEAPILQYDFG